MVCFVGETHFEYGAKVARDNEDMQQMERLLMNKYFRRFCLLSGIYLVLTSFASGLYGSTAGPSSAWPWMVSDLAPDPELHYGTLVNGFRYVLRKNQEPKNRVAIDLYIQAGSLHENDEQRGLAHFLEHMMFKGTENFPAGSLVEYFQSIGMNFGSDANAHTTFDQTVYNILLPNGSEKELNTGFSVMADYARRAKLEEDQINQERGVILAEKRARDSAAYRTQVASMEYGFRGAKIAKRMVIGVEGSLLSANRAILKSFYDTWYHPENMILIVVGDMEPKIAEQLIEKHFSQLSPAGKRPDFPEFGILAHKGTEGFYHYEPELGKTNVSIESFWGIQPKNDSLELEKEELIQLVGTMIMGYRLQQVQEEKKPPFSRASYNAGDIIERIGYGAISAQTDAGKWQESLGLLDKTLRQAIQYGFTEQEVLRSRKEILAELDSSVLTAKTEDSRTIAQKLLRHLGSNRVYQSPEQEKALYGPIVEQITVDQVNRQFRTVWSHDSRLVSVTGDVKLPEDGARVVVDQYQLAVREVIVGPPTRSDDTFPYLPVSAPPEKTPVASDFKEIDIQRLVFANGLIINLKKTDFQKNSIQILASYGSGEQSEPAPGMAMLAEDIINVSGSGRLPQSAIDTIVAGSSVNLKFHIGETAFSWSGSSLSKDFELLVQMLHTFLYDHGFRENQFGNVRKKVEQMYQKVSQEVDGAMVLDVQPFLAGGNQHFGLPLWKDVARIQYAELAQWAQTFSQPRDLELSVVGDFNTDEVVRYLSKYFGGVNLQGPRIPDTAEIRFPTGRKLLVDVNTSIDKSLVVVAWPTDDFWDIGQTRRLQMLSDVFEDRVRKVVREKLGAAYSPTVSSFNSRVYKGFGFLMAQVIVKPGSEEAIIKEIMEISERLKVDGITTDELVRAQRPMVTSITDTIRTNRYWLSSVLALSSRYPQLFEWPKTILSDYSAVNENDLNQLAQKYFDNSRLALAKVLPSGDSKKVVERLSIITD